MPLVRLSRLVASGTFALVLVFHGAASFAQQNPDAQVLGQLRKAGSNLSKPHEMEFFLLFPAEAGAVRTVSKLTMQGYAVESANLGKTQGWVVRAARTMVPAEAELVAVRKQMTQLAKENGGAYDGWGAGVVK